MGINNGGNCSGDHRYFVADVAVNEGEGSVTIIALCTACGKFIEKKVDVAPGTQTLKGKHNESVQG